MVSFSGRSDDDWVSLVVSDFMLPELEGMLEDRTLSSSSNEMNWRAIFFFFRFSFGRLSGSTGTIKGQVVYQKYYILKL